MGVQERGIKNWVLLMYIGFKKHIMSYRPCDIESWRWGGAFLRLGELGATEGENMSQPWENQECCRQWEPRCKYPEGDLLGGCFPDMASVRTLHHSEKLASLAQGS